MLLLVMVGFGLTGQAQGKLNHEDTWAAKAESFTQLYSLATEISKETENVQAQGSVVSVTTSKGTVSIEQKKDKSKPADKLAFKYNLLTTTGKTVPLATLENVEKGIEAFYSKLLKVKDMMRENYEQDIDDALNQLFSN